MRFRKTDKGQAEIDGAARQLPPRLRMVLLLVDGQRSVADLQAMQAGVTPQALRILRDEGYIEAVSDKARRAAIPAHPAPAASAAEPVSDAADTPSRFDVASRPADEAATDKQRAQIERSLRRALGPTADSLIEVVRKATTVHELVEVLKSAQRAISNARGPEIADEFASRFASLDDRSQH